MIPRALGDASGSPAWPSDEARVGSGAPAAARARRLLTEGRGEKCVMSMTGRLQDVDEAEAAATAAIAAAARAGVAVAVVDDRAVQHRVRAVATVAAGAAAATAATAACVRTRRFAAGASRP